jgi:predicted aspartyl protease
MSTMIASASVGQQQLIAQGPIFAVTVIGPSGSESTHALIDTGSTVSSVDRGLLASVGAVPIGSVPVTTVQGTQTDEVYEVLLSAGGIQLNPGLHQVLGDDLAAPVQVLIGRDILAGAQLAYDGPSGGWVLWETGLPIASPGPASPWIAVGAVAVAGLGIGLLLSAFARAERREGAVEARLYGRPI